MQITTPATPTSAADVLRPATLTILCSLLILSAACRVRSAYSITLAGSTSVEPFAERLAEVYMAAHKGCEINVQGGGSSAGIRAVQSGICQIGMSSRALTPDEKGLTEVPIATDAITLIVNKQNPVSTLTASQARDVFAGRIKNWSELGGPDRSITVVTREEGSGTRASFEEKVMTSSDTLQQTAVPGHRSTPIARSALVQDSNGAVREIVASDPASVGYISYGLLDERVKPLALDGVPANDATIRSGAYPVTRTFLLLTTSKASEATRSFIYWILSDEGQRVLAEEGLTPVR